MSNNIFSTLLPLHFEYFDLKIQEKNARDLSDLPRSFKIALGIGPHIVCLLIQTADVSTELSIEILEWTNKRAIGTYRNISGMLRNKLNIPPVNVPIGNEK